jgi:5-methylcytosine-specific restriction endonuclease McrA
MATRRKISAATRQRLEVIADYRCRYCRSPMAAGVAMVVEHIIPLAADGSNQNAPFLLQNFCSLKPPRRADRKGISLESFADFVSWWLLLRLRNKN